MRLIPLTQGKFAIVDDEDYEELNKHKWHAHKEGGTFYARCCVWRDHRAMHLRMHRKILGALASQQCDHINGNGLDNRRSNLRICTHAENGWNRKLQEGTSIFKGVDWVKAKCGWQARIMCNNVRHYLGVFGHEGDAARAYDTAARELFGEFARLNFPEGIDV